ncbi:hypothetical protein HMPREF0762_00843 [Slackia exigua ATCC 700122]|uniref:Uncharacterized protein n=1 Tax=Slackia exigua (strain ATCC 700122 / DSM 15923 / CIP 105133 / JCM 11022 / KCTC 5966 / S-7) TaxID=649764 RepID=D0WG92_SLAES|nr:hypothetical protein HMPREF0762_00843 [Slackia exigua ATCC 700122]
MMHKILNDAQDSLSSDFLTSASNSMVEKGLYPFFSCYFS